MLVLSNYRKGERENNKVGTLLVLPFYVYCTRQNEWDNPKVNRCERLCGDTKFDWDGQKTIKWLVTCKIAK